MQRQKEKRAASNLTRRDVLRTTAGVGLMAALGTNFAHAQGSDVIKVGLIGCGGRGGGALGDCIKGAEKVGAKVEVWAVGDFFAEKAQNRAKQYKIPPERCFSGLDSYKGVIDSGVDLVCMATPPGFRPYHFAYAIEKGKHVFFEKPVAVDPHGVRMVIEAGELAKQKKLGVVAGTQRRHQGEFIENIQRIHDGMIGDIVHMSVYWCGGGIWSRPRQPGMSDVEYQIHNWYHYVWLCGDQIVEQHVHNLDVAQWVMRANPISAYGVGSRHVRTTAGHIYDNFTIEYEYPNGARVLSMCRHWPGDGAGGEFVVGTKGTARPGEWVMPRGGQRIAGKSTGSGYVNEHADLIKSIRDGKPLNEARQVAESTMVAIMGRLAAYTGKRVTWDFVMNKSKLKLMPEPLDPKGSLPEPPVAIPGKEPLI